MPKSTKIKSIKNQKHQSITKKNKPVWLWTLGISLILTFISLGVYLVLAVAPGTVTPPGPPPGNDVTWAPLTVDQTNNRVGINNPTPGQALDVTGQIHASQDICTDAGPAGGKCLSSAGGGSLWTQSGTNIYYNTGNVGIGTTSPSAPLEVSANAARNTATQLLSLTGAWGGNANEDHGLVIQGPRYGASDPNTSLLHIKNSDGTSLLRVTDYGNVGIGTTGPGQKLTVAGTIESTSGGFKFPDGTTQATAATTGWPSGSYCIFRNGGSCPSGFVYDEIALEIGSHDHDMCPGDEVAGDSTFSGSGFCSVRVRMCCK